MLPQALPLLQPELHVSQITVSRFLNVPFLCCDPSFPHSNYGASNVAVDTHTHTHTPPPGRRLISIFVIHTRGPWVVIITPVLGAFVKLRNETISFVMSLRPSVRPSVRPSSWNNSVPIGRIFMKFDICRFFKNLSRNFKFH